MLFSGRVPILGLLVLGILAIGLHPLFAQNEPKEQILRIQGNQLPRDMFPPEMLPPLPLTPEEELTIERSIRDLQSDDSEVRAGAAMLLGKYEHAIARDAVVQALQDPSERVRRAALISVVEWNRGAPGSAVTPVIRLLNDPDVEIRRAASSALSTMMGIRRTYQVIRPQSEAAAELSPELEDIIRRAFLDQDVIVRRNMLNGYHSLGMDLPPETWISLLRDPDLQVRLAALPIASRQAPSELFFQEAATIAKSDHRVERLQLAREITSRANRPEAHAILIILADDPDREIAAEALIGRLRHENSPALIQEAIRVLLSSGMSQEQGLRFFRVLRQNLPFAAPYLPRLIEIQDATLRREAVSLYLTSGQASDNPDVIVQILNDRSPEVRQEIIHHLMAERIRPIPSLIATMLSSPHTDVRAGLIHVSNRLPDAQAADILFDLLLDERQEIRASALRNLTERKLPGWSDALGATLRDPDIQMQRLALGLILRNPHEGDHIALQRFLNEYPDSPLAVPIRAHLGTQPTDS